MYSEKLVKGWENERMLSTQKRERERERERKRDRERERQVGKRKVGG